MLESIEIKSYPVHVRLGCFPHERLSTQEVIVNLWAKLEAKVTPRTDQLEETVDYVSIMKVIDETVQGKEVSLIETVADRIGRALLVTFPKLTEVRINVEKTLIPRRDTKGARVHVEVFLERNKL